MIEQGGTFEIYVTQQGSNVPLVDMAARLLMLERRDVIAATFWYLSTPESAELLARMLTIRLQLDDSGPGDGPLRVLPGSHCAGKLGAPGLAAWSTRAALDINIPRYIRETVEQIAFAAREDKRVDKRSGVSQRLPISTLELVVSNAERRALIHGEAIAVPRIGDIYAALPGISGKIDAPQQVYIAPSGM